MKVLQIGLGTVQGGLEAFVMNYYRVLVHMDVQFDYVCMYDEIAYAREIKSLGGHVYYVPNVKKDYVGYKKALKKILQEGSYHAVHVNMLSAANIVPLRVAHKMGIKKVIAHCHSSSCPGLVRNLMNWWNRPFINRYATDKFACAIVAGKWMFGEKAFANGEVTVINNAIHIDKFAFSMEKRNRIRQEMGWENKLVIGHVGRFDIPKNHQRMIPVMEEVTKKNPNAVLALIGGKEGLYQKIQEKTDQAGLRDKICFAGKQDDVCSYLCAMDVFLFPSLFEGVPFALIEAQANGLPCVMADSVSEEAVVFPERVSRLSLNESDQVWAENILKMSEIKREEPEVLKKKLKEAHFDITTEANRLRDLYKE